MDSKLQRLAVFIDKISDFCDQTDGKSFKTFVHGTTVIQMQCKTRSKMDFLGHFVMICMHIKLTNA